MRPHRIERINVQLRREIGALLFRIVNDVGFDLSAVTVTHVLASSDLRSARVLVSIRDHESERTRMLTLLAHHRAQIQDHIAHALRLKYTPVLRFELDPSLEQGDRVLQLLDEIPPSPEPAAQAPSGERDAP
jgi:ribosome-binding factor A